MAADAVLKLANASGLEWLATVGLSWVETIIDDQFELFANRLWLLEDCLSELRRPGAVTDEVRSRYHRIVDGLAAAGDRSAIRLQQLDE
jgi:hypothetical protein